MRQIIAITNEKGGVAKTTTALSLGAALAETGKTVLMIDMDAQANLTLGAGIQPAKVRRGISDVLMNSDSITSVSKGTAIEGLDIIPSNANMGLAERFLPIRPDHERILSQAIRTLPNYDYVLIDCPPSLGAVTMNAMTAANLVIIPTQPEYFSIYGLRGVLAAVRRVRSQSNPSLNYRVLITMLDRRNRIHLTLSEQLRTTFTNGVYTTVIEIDTKLRESNVVGMPITQYMPKSRSAFQYRALAQELMDHVQETTV